MKWTLHLHVGNAEDASEHIDSLWEFVSSARYKAFHFSVSRSFIRSFCYSLFSHSFCLIQTLLHTCAEAGQIGVNVEHIAVKIVC